MAGESPDRSKKRESSEQKTSGSASPVPEARSEASAEARDPRLSVARDAEKSSARGGVDTATRVFSVRTPDEPTDTSPDTPDPKKPTDATGDAEQGDGDAAAAGDGERGDSDADVEGAAEDAERDESDAGEDDAVGGAEDGDSGAGAAADESQEPAEASAEGADGDSGSGRGDDTAGSDGRLRDAVAAWVASADSEEGKEPAAAEGRDERAESAEKDSTDGREAAEGTDEPTKAGTDDQEAESADEPAEADADARDGQEDAESAGESPEEPADAPGAQEAVEEASEDAEASQDEDDEPEADRSSTADSADTDAPEADADADSADTDAPEADADADSEPGTAGSEAGTKPDEDDEDDGTASDADSAADTDDEASKPKDPRASHDSASSPKAAKPKDPRASDDTEDSSPETKPDAKPDDDEGSSDEPVVDQPTAVFKAPRPAVDQPTTMLKIGDAAKGKDAPEREAERTSKFVALKPLDDPATRKPAAPAAPAPAPAEATAPVPTVSPERTTQQPLPPRPPLDMLAELTNTPPPPDTPLRTAVRRVKIWTPLALLLVIVFAVVQNVRPLPTPTLELTAKDSYTFEGGKVDIPWPADGQAALDVQGIGTFGSSGEQKPVPIASVAKVMTAYVILREHPLKSGEDGPKIGIDQAAEDQSDAGQESTVDVTKGDKITQREALESILIASANNVARLLSRWDAGSEKAFVQKMNDAAKDLGMKNTTYTDPSGLNNTTVSTAVDQVKLARAAMEQPAFREVAAMMSYVDYKGTKHDNWNRLVGYNNVTGIKTGTTTSALGNLVFSAKKDVDGETHRVIGAVVRQPAGGPDNTILGAALHEGDRLIRAAQGALESATILKKGDIVGYADDGLGGRTPVAVTEDVTAVGWAGLSVKLTFAPDELPHTAKAGQKVGTLTVGDGSTSAVKVPVALQQDLVEPGFADKLTRIG
ncbi:D-alanyl-D-alanine carboxypeptidase [Streptomyces sp. NPDC056948]|uniref:D-alanyl-D-alanine carboxypeptidase n=1 Tax=Streptomyces sp. NPDC056948 TaxID=3345975 RepID=UPI00362B9A18